MRAKILILVTAISLGMSACSTPDSQQRVAPADQAPSATTSKVAAAVKPKPAEPKMNAGAPSEVLRDTEQEIRQPSSSILAEQKAQPLKAPQQYTGKGKPSLKRQAKAKLKRESSRADFAQGIVGFAPAPAPVPQIELQRLRQANEPVDRENYQHFDNNPVKRVAEHPVSTFSIDVDTGSYTNVRRILRAGRLPVKDAVRVEEFINYFSYDYPLPKDRQRPFNIVTEMGPNPWNQQTRLLHIGIKGYDVSAEQLPPANLVFLVDVSGSMHSHDKLPLLKNAFKMLTQKLRAQDHVAIVVYAGASGTVLAPTSGRNKFQILSALEQLSAGGSTNGAAGIRLAYNLAQQSYVKNGINRVILATDGDFNVGTVNFEALKNLIEEQRQSGITLTTLGFGSGNYNDKLMEQLADAGNGNYAYIDSLMEARKALVDEMGSTLLTIAKDVKIQIEFNPKVVTEYRLIGYENRMLKREDFNNDKIDAGDIGAGHTVTAIYEIALANGEGQRVDPLRYQGQEKRPMPQSGELAFLKIRYKQPNGEKSRLIQQAIQQQDMLKTLAATSERYRFSASVAAFGQLLRGGTYTEDFKLQQLLKLAQQSKGQDLDGYRGEFIQLVKLAESMREQTNTAGLDMSH